MAKFTAVEFPFVVQNTRNVCTRNLIKFYRDILRHAKKFAYLDGCTIHRRSVEGKQDRFLVDDEYWQILAIRYHDFLAVGSRIEI